MGPHHITTVADPDCDGFTEEEGDCNPENGLVYPGATEIPYDGHDNDCAGDGDWNDIDGDGYVGVSAEGGDDCDDNNPNVFPGAPEICYDGIDQDCAGDVELENNNDCDGDGHIGRGTEATDCDDEDPNVNPDASEVWYDGRDQNCDGWDDFDQDFDGDPIADERDEYRVGYCLCCGVQLGCRRRCFCDLHRRMAGPWIGYLAVSRCFRASGVARQVAPA